MLPGCCAISGIKKFYNGHENVNYIASAVYDKIPEELPFPKEKIFLVVSNESVNLILATNTEFSPPWGKDNYLEITKNDDRNYFSYSFEDKIIVLNSLGGYTYTHFGTLPPRFIQFMYEEGLFGFFTGYQLSYLGDTLHSFEKEGKLWVSYITTNPNTHNDIYLIASTKIALPKQKELLDVSNLSEITENIFTDVYSVWDTAPVELFDGTLKYIKIEKLEKGEE